MPALKRSSALGDNRPGQYKALILHSAPHFRRVKRLGLPALAIVLLGLLAIMLARLVGQSTIDVSLDLIDPGPDAPTVSFFSSGARWGLGPMQALPADRGIRHARFSLVATGEKNPAAKGHEVWLIHFPSPEGLVQDPPGSWTSRDGNLIATSDQPTKVSWDGEGPISITLLSHPWSGVATVDVGTGPQRIDLYGPGGDGRTIQVEGKPSTRYRLAVPRRALRGLTFDLGSAFHGEVARVYVGSIIPRWWFSFVPTQQPWGEIVAPWQPELRQHQFTVSSLSPVEQGGWMTCLVFWALLIAGTGLAALSFSCAVALLRRLRTPSPERMLLPFRPRVWLAFCVPLLTLWTLGWLAFYPGLVAIDSMDQWTQIVHWQLSDHHPAFDTLFIYILTRLWNTPAAVVVIQMTALAAVVSYGFVLLLRAGASRWVIGVLYGITLLSPSMMEIAIDVVKDTPFTILVLGLALALGQHLLAGRQRAPWSYWIGIGLLLALVTLFRHNGILITVGVGALLPLFFWNDRRRALLAGLTAIIALVTIRGGLYRVLGVQGRWFSHRATTFVWDIGSLVQDDVPFSAEEHAFLEKIRHLDDQRWMYTPESVAVTFYGDPEHALDFVFADQHLSQFTRLHTQLLERYPGYFLRHVLRADAYLFEVQRDNSTTEINDFIFFLDDDSAQQLRMASLGFPMAPVLPRLKAAVVNALQPTLVSGPAWSSLLWRPAFWMYLSLLGVALGIYRTREWRLLLVAAPMVLNTASLLFGVAQESRFQYPVFACFALLAGLAGLPRFRDGAVELERPTPSAVDTPNGQAIGG